MRSTFGPVAPAVENMTGVSEMLEIRDAWRFFEEEMKAHPEFAAVAATVLDVIGVIGGIIGVITLISAGAIPLIGALTATVASGFLLRADGYDAKFLLDHNEAAAAKWENSKFYRRTELLAPLLVLPDAARAGIGVAKDAEEGITTVREANESLENAKGQHEVLIERVKKRIASHGDDKNLPKKEVHRISNISKRAEIAAQRVKVAEALRLEKEAQLRLAILKSIARDGPGLLSAT